MLSNDLHPQLVKSAEYSIRTYEIDSNKRVTIPALSRLMQEAAMQNVIDLGVSVWDLEPYHISWVLMRKKMQFHTLPMLGETIQVVTNPAGFEKFFTYRDFRVTKTDGSPVATASSTWMLMDTNTRQMSRIPEHILAYRMPNPADCLPRPSGKLPKFERADHEQTYQVQWHELDFNEHLSNSYYFQFMLETLPESILRGGIIKELDIQYRLECRWHDEVISQMQILEENVFLHRLIRKDDGKEIASMLTRF